MSDPTVIRTPAGANHTHTNGEPTTNPAGETSTPSAGGVESVVAAAVDEFTDRVNRGEHPDPAEYADRYPQAASILRDILPALLAVRPDAPAGAAPASPPSQVGGYVLARELGRGGMGRVYLAVHAALKRTAAVKMVTDEKADPKDLIRFLAEAEAVAAVSHPHVVQVFDYGEDAGRPFLVLELLAGGTLAEKLKAGPLTPTASAELVAAISRGVAAAHALGIVHRDLKPGNVLFDSVGVPKVTDFGLAKRRDSDLTATRAIMGTPAYMAPEQAGGQAKFVGPQADVWSLGVVLYECLTGRRPFAGDDVWQVIDAVRGTEPPSTRSLSASVPRDLDLICRKCLEKNPADRYATAAELADDLDRFLAGKPVSVRPVRPHERAWKWVKRNKIVAGLLFAVFAALTAGLAASLTYAWREKQANNVAEDRLRDIQAKSKELEGANTELVARAKRLELSNGAIFAIFDGMDPDNSKARGNSLRVELGLRLAAAGKRLDELAGGDPMAVAAMRHQLARSLSNLGDYESAVEQLEQLRREVTAARGPDHDDTLNVLADLATAYRKWEKHAEAVKLQREVARIRAAKAGPDDEDMLISQSQLGATLVAADQLEEAIRVLEDCTRRFAAKYPPENPHRLVAEAHLASAYRDAGRPADALKLYERLAPLFAKFFGPGDAQTVRVENNLAVALNSAGRPKDAITILEPLLPRYEKHFENPEHPVVLGSVETLGGAYQDAGRYADAAKMYDRLVNSGRRTRAKDDPILVLHLSMLGWTRVQAGQFAEAEPVLREALALREKSAPGAWGVGNLKTIIGESLLGQKKPAEAEPLLLEGYKLLKERIGQLPPKWQAIKLADARERVAKLYDATDRPEEAKKVRAGKDG